MHAIFFERYKVKDLQNASDMASELAEIAVKRGDLPVWAYNMQAYILNDMGQEKAAYAILTSVLATNADNLDPTEVNSTIVYICEQVLTKKQAARNKMCENYK